MIGKSWSMAQLSGSDWNTEKLQKYVSERIASRSSSSSGSRSSLRQGAATGAQARPLNPHRQCAEFERQQPDVEHLQHLLTRGQRIVIALDQPPLAHRAIRHGQVLDRRRQLLVAAVVVGPVAPDREVVERRGAAD